MLYVKAQLNDQVEIKVDLYEDEIFTSCGGCEKEMPVDQKMILSLLNDGDDFTGTTWFCPDCTQKRRSSGNDRDH